MRSIAICVLLVLCACGDEVFIDVEGDMSREVAAPRGILVGRLGESVVLNSGTLQSYALVEAYTDDGLPIEAVLSLENATGVPISVTAQWGVGAALFTARLRTTQATLVLPVRGSNFRLLVSQEGSFGGRLAGFVAPGTAPPARYLTGFAFVAIPAGATQVWSQESLDVPMTDIMIPAHANAIRFGRGLNTPFAAAIGSATVEVAAGGEMDWHAVTGGSDIAVINRGAIADSFVLWVELS